MADDAEINRELIIELLRKRGHIAEGVANGRQVLAALEQRSFDVVVLDEEMPEMTGLQATAAIRLREATTGKHQIIIGISGHATEDDEHKFREAGMDASLAKPVEVNKLYEVLESSVPQSRPVARAASEVEHSAPAASVPPALPSELVPAPRKPAFSPAPSEDVVAHLRRTTGGNEKLIRSLAATFLEDAPKALARIRGAVAKSDAAELASAAHLLKGSLAIFGAPKAVAAARNLEALGRANDLREAAAGLRTLESEFALLQSELGAIQSAAKSKPRPKPQSPSQTQTLTNQATARLARLLLARSGAILKHMRLTIA